MGFFDSLFGGNGPDVPNTISDEQANDLGRRAAKYDKTDWLNPTAEETARADRDDLQHSRRWWS